MARPISPLMARVGKKDPGRGGRAAERNITKRVQGRNQPGSGAIDSAKGDVVLDTPKPFLIENKSSKNNSFSIKLDELLKIHQEALEVNRNPALSFQFITGNGSSTKERRWVCVPEDVFKELVDP